MKKTLILPQNHKVILSSCESCPEFFDIQDKLFRDKHIGLYIMSTSERVYLEKEAYKEYKYKTMLPNQKAFYEKMHKGCASHNLYSLFPSRKEEIWILLQQIYTYQKSTILVKDLLRGIKDLIIFIEYSNVNLQLTLELVTKENMLLLKKYVERDECPISRGRYLSKVLYLMMGHTKHRFELPYFDKIVKDRKFSVRKKIQDRNKSNSDFCDDVYDKEGKLSIPVGWQIDVYCRKELDSWIKLIEEFNEWKKEYEIIRQNSSGIITLKNLAYTYFHHRDIAGKGSSNYLKFYNEIAKKLYGLSFNWKDKAEFSKLKGKHKSSKALKYEKKLRSLGDEGISIEINDLRMYTLWMLEVFPDYPFSTIAHEKFQSISYFTTSTKFKGNYQGSNAWRINNLKKLNINPFDYLSLYTSTSYHLYPLYALILLRSGLNQEVVQDWKIQRQDNGIYSIGKIAGPVHIIEGYKGRSNSIQSYTLDIEVSKYVQFFLKHMSSLYDISKKNNFFQYRALSGGKCYIWSKSTQSNLQKKKQVVPIFGKYEIFTNSGKRVHWIDHRQIRAMKNFSEYRNDVTRIQRQIEMGHLNAETLEQYQQSLVFKGSDDVKIAITQNTTVAIFKGIITSEENKKAAIFEEQPMNKCSNPKKPSYPNFTKLKDAERCVNWRLCLLCSECVVIPRLHGPVIQAWQNVIIEEDDNYYSTEEWEKEFKIDFTITTNVLNMFDDNERNHCIKEAPKFQEFVRAYVMNSLNKIQDGV